MVIPRARGRYAKIGVINNDNADQKHNTQNEIAKAAGVSTGKVAQAEIVRREAPELWAALRRGGASPPYRRFNRQRGSEPI